MMGIQKQIRCWSCSFIGCILDNDKENQQESVYCPRCGWLRIWDDFDVQNPDHAGATTYRMKGSHERLGAYAHLEVYREWVANNRHLLVSATYTMKIGEDWFLVDALTGSMQEFGAHG